MISHKKRENHAELGVVIAGNYLTVRIYSMDQTHLLLTYMMMTLPYGNVRNAGTNPQMRFKKEDNMQIHKPTLDTCWDGGEHEWIDLNEFEADFGFRLCHKCGTYSYRSLVEGKKSPISLVWDSWKITVITMFDDIETI